MNAESTKFTSAPLTTGFAINPTTAVATCAPHHLSSSPHHRGTPDAAELTSAVSASCTSESPSTLMINDEIAPSTACHNAVSPNSCVTTSPTVTPTAPEISVLALQRGHHRRQYRRQIAVQSRGRQLTSRWPAL